MTENEYIKEHFPLLSEIDSPADLKKLSVDRLPAVCDELRRFMIHELSTNPGHFASSMGAVEIVVALHYVMDTPHDRIVWDVGHQAYAHKILTGRRDQFHSNRKRGGLSGFPNPLESEYDTFVAGHASNSISAALGMSVASKMSEKVEPGRHVVAVIGDASIGGGLAFEGINNAAIHDNNLMIVLNDNDMSIDRPVGSLSRYMTRLSTSKGYNNMRYKTYNFMRRHHMIGDSGKGIVLRFNNAMKSMLTGQQNIFEGLNIRYFGPFDGHDVKALVKLFNEVKEMTGPKILHLHTKKGKGFEPAEKDPTTWHAPGKFDENTGERPKRTPSPDTPPKYQDVMGRTLVELAKDDERVVGITAAMPGGTSMCFMQEEFPRRTFDVGISEGHAVTFAGGLAKEGKLPFVAIYSSFLQRAYDHIIHDVAIARLPVTFVIDRGGLVGEDGVTHHGLFDLAYMRTVPGMVVSAPMNEHWLRNLMFTAHRRADGPMAIRYPRGSGVLGQWRNEMEEVEIGRGRRLAEGDEVAILSLGHIGNNVARAVESLANEGIRVGHYDMVFLKPLDEAIVKEAASRYRWIITVEDGTTVGGLGSAVAEWLAEHETPCRLVKMGVPDTFIDQGTVAELQACCHIDAEGIANQVKELINLNRNK
ncbi:MAG: 1-deoxy-D-xylulose-5-phosphate synthase [Muribaculaceae bacterium]|nr:1-deoxy-D-xylulose-5-phosphate synthase [Muribaculaceae bacterium]